MEAADIIKKIRKIEIKTKGLSKQLFAGEYHSAFKGKGMSFSEVRQYAYGDDVRSIDWNVTARTGEPHIKVFEEERELTVMFLVDMSRSSFFGTDEQFKNQKMTEIAAVLAFSAINNNDKVGAILFTDEIEKYIPPQKGKKHILLIVRQMLYLECKSKGTNISKALQYLNNVQKKRSIVFLLSDFLDDNFATDLKLANKRHDVIGLHIFDEKEIDLPNVGLIKLRDPETEKIQLVDTSSRAVRNHFKERFENHATYIKQTFAKSRSDIISIGMKDDYVKALLEFFKKR